MICFFSENIDFDLDNKNQIKHWLNEIIQRRNFKTGTINFIFCNDAFLLDLNIKYLNHDTLTDIITFDYSQNSFLSGDIYISIERVKENADLFKKTFLEELHRVMVHGILHLCGLKDKTEDQSKEMRNAEDESLAELINH